MTPAFALADSLNCSFRMSGIQSLHHPPGDGRQREVEHEQEKVAVAQKFRATARTGVSDGAVGVGGPRRILQDEKQRHRVDHADEPARAERPAPAVVRRIGHIAGEAAENDADVNAHLMQADGARARRPVMEIGDQRERRRDVKRLADAHDRAGGDEFIETSSHAPSTKSRRPDEEARRDDVPAAETIRDVAADRTQDRIDPLERAEHQAPVGLGRDVGMSPTIDDFIVASIWRSR